MKLNYLFVIIVLIFLINFVSAEPNETVNQSLCSPSDPASCYNPDNTPVTDQNVTVSQETPVTVEPTLRETLTIPSNESLCSERTGTIALTSFKAQSFATNTLESMSSSSSWDVAVRFDNAPGNSFYPFSPSPGVVGTPYYAVLGSSDNLVKWIPYCYRGCGWDTCYWAILGRKPCEQLSTSCESLDPLTSGCICFGGLKNRAKMDGWFVERTRISDTKYHVKIVGQSVGRADPRGTLWLNPDSGWMFTHLDSCYVQADQGYPPRPASCALTSDTMLQFQTAGDCGGSCACEDAGGINIDVIVEKTATPTPTPTPISLTYSITNVETFPGAMNLAPKGTYACKAVQRELSEWSLKFYNRDSAVTKADFGPQGLATSTFHYHYGHGDQLAMGTGIRLTNGWVQPVDVFRAWNEKNKWVLIDACNILSDPNWGNALVSSHGILGFATDKPSDWQIPQKFFPKVNAGETIYDAYRKATEEAYHGKGVKAAVIFHNQNQLEKDHFPPGYVAPDGSPDDNPVYKVWEV